jgi:hypothetical protein
METTNQKIVDKINTYFDNASYSELHSNDIWFTIIIFIVVIFVALYFFIISAIKSYKTSWQQDKCNPLLMPFASVINSEESKGKELDYIINNFNECLNTLNAELAQQAKKPIESAALSIEGIFGSIHTAFIELQNFIVYMYNLILQIFTLIMNKLQIILENIKYFFMNMNDFFAKVLSSLTVTYYTLTLLVQSFRAIFVVFVTGWLLTMVIPAALSPIILLVTLMILIIIFYIIWATFPLLGPLLAYVLIGVLFGYTIGFLVAIIWLILVCIMYGIFNRFVEKAF